MDQSSQTQTEPVQANKGNNTVLKATTIITSILAICGISFGIYGLTRDSKTPDTAESGSSETATIDNSPNTKTNPIITDDDSYIYGLDYETDVIPASDGSGAYSAHIRVRNGEASCYINKLEEDNSVRYSKDCDSITGFSGKISTVAGAGKTQSYMQTIVFLMEDGTVSYIKTEDLINSLISNNTAQVQKTLKIDGFVTDIDTVSAFPQGKDTGGFSVTFFTLSDGTFIQYDDSLLN